VERVRSVSLTDEEREEIVEALECPERIYIRMARSTEETPITW
jgi:hypothetical protein